MLTLAVLRKRERPEETWTDSDLYASWAKQIGWWQAETDFLRWYDRRFKPPRWQIWNDNPGYLGPFIQLEKLPNLRNVETVGYWDENYRTPHPGRYHPSMNQWQASRKEGDHWDYDTSPNKCLEMFCLQLERSRVNISSLTVTCLREIIDPHGPGLDLANLSTLTLDLASEANCAWDKFPDADQSYFSSWFTSAASKLKNLNIIQSWLTDDAEEESWYGAGHGIRHPYWGLAVDIFAVMSSGITTVQFPMLQNLHLQHVTTTAFSLTKFLNVHRKTLVSLKIDRPCIDAEEWNRMRQRIEEEAAQGYYGPESGCEISLTDAMTDPLGMDKDWQAFYDLIW